MRFSLAVPVGALIGVLAGVLTGCTAAPQFAVSPATASTTPVAAATVAPSPEDARGPATSADSDDFCALAAPMLVPVPREFVGSEEHVAQFAALREAAPEELVGLIGDLERHYDVAVSPANPDSQDFENFPQGIQDQALALNAAIAQRCGATA